MYECHPKHSGIVQGGLFEPREDPPAFLEPSDQSFNDVAISVCVRIEWLLPGVAIFVQFRRNHRLNPVRVKHRVDILGAIAFIPCDLFRPGNGHPFEIDNTGIRVFYQSRKCLCFMHLSSSQFKRQRMAIVVADQMDLRGKTSSGPAKCMVRRFAWIPFFPPPPAHRAARITVPSTCQTS